MCDHPDRGDIDRALAFGESGYRAIAGRFGLSKSAVERHGSEHLPAHLAKAAEAGEVADADDLLADVSRLQERTLAILEAAEDTGQLRTALSAIRECRGNLELLGRITKELDTGPTLNLHLSAEWVSIRTVLFEALAEHPEARWSVVEALERLEVASSG